MMLRERLVPQSEVIWAVVLEVIRQHLTTVRGDQGRRWTAAVDSGGGGSRKRQWKGSEKKAVGKAAEGQRTRGSEHVAVKTVEVIRAI